MAGSSRHGGVLLLAGDDHTAKSSTTAHQCELTFKDLMIPVLNPANVQEFLDLGLYGWAMSRYSGCWIGFKTISETVESSSSVDLDPARTQIVLPRSEEHTSELQSLMRTSYAVFCLKKKKQIKNTIPVVN